MGKKKNRKPQAYRENGNLSVEVDPVEKNRLDRARKISRETTKCARDQASKNRAYAEGLDADEVRSKRRISATLGLMDRVKALAESLCPDIPDAYEFEKEWLEQNLLPLHGYDYTERYNYNLVSASLWMLDQLREEWKFFEACQVFPQGDCIYEEMDFPEFWDASHEFESVLGMLWVIRHRNDDCVGLKEPKKKEKALTRYYLDDYTAADLHRQDVPSRRNFEYVMARIPRERIDEAVQLYEDTFWDVLCRILRTYAVYAQRRQELDAREKDLNRETESFIAELKGLPPALQGREVVNRPVLAMRNPQDGIAGRLPEGRRRGADAWVRVQQIAAEEEQLEQDMEKLELQFFGVRRELGEMLMATKEIREGFYGAEVAAIWEDFQIKDPYALSFAFLYLVEQNSDLPWTYGVSVHLMDLCASVLPWRYDRFDVEVDAYWRHYDPETGAPVPAAKGKLPKRIKVPDLEDWYAMQYENLAEPDHACREANNLAQIIYELTGGIMPRNLKRYEGALEVLDNYGISGKRATHPLVYCMTLLAESRHQTQIFHLSEKPLEPDSKEAAEEDQEVSVEELRRQLDGLRRENKQLRNAAHTAGREARDVRKKLDALEDAVRAERQELADLRELVFHQQGEICAVEEADLSIEFPYSVRQRVVVFGGHDSWAREIKPKLTGVRFVDRGMLPNAEMIRQADVVWIQTNALSHKHYYKIIDEVRKYRVPVRYFSYGSPIKCAEQVVREDMGNN